MHLSVASCALKRTVTNGNAIKYSIPVVSFQGVPEAGKFPSTEELIMTLTSIMYACTVGHAAVNGPQYDEYAFLPNYPALLKGEPPRDKVRSGGSPYTLVISITISSNLVG